MIEICLSRTREREKNKKTGHLQFYHKRASAALACIQRHVFYPEPEHDLIARKSGMLKAMLLLSLYVQSKLHTDQCSPDTC